jgi:hypothetical protein
MHLTWYNLFILYTHSQVGQGWSSPWLDDALHSLERIIKNHACSFRVHFLHRCKELEVVNCNCYFAPLCHLHSRGLVDLSHTRVLTRVRQNQNEQKVIFNFSILRVKRALKMRCLINNACYATRRCFIGEETKLQVKFFLIKDLFSLYVLKFGDTCVAEMETSSLN